MYFGNIYPFLTEEEIKKALLRQINHSTENTDTIYKYLRKI